ncbi:DHA2 family efflux MFS transporter permease subunit [Desulfosporosinus sp. PR]|uniref:DHA2 family efflux MFS transporter permease subunit n=1 Tax=Candidatus Desulfosporosinus nitrosoreducens TaxID=3401928 RepID=UPI0027FD38EF|nr:DHA2 family efflux MFS transporter permease subunit [Desulfosporosinus sp. PR]MDQ7095929.1 DHA2 family efflux MFS transporter permease subunit [Desulfosporosinus sp. PR]
MIILVFGYVLFGFALLIFVNMTLIGRKDKNFKRTNKNSQILDEPAIVEPSMSSASNIAGPVQAPIIPPRTKPTRAGVPQFNTLQILTVLMLGAFVSILNQTLDNVAIPHMMLDFNVSASTIQWIVTGYMLVNGVLIPITAFLMESVGSRKLVLAAMISFTLGSFICALAPTFPVFMIGRIIQGIGAGILMPLLTNVFLSIFPPQQRGKALGTMGIVMVFAPAIGPTLGGWVVQTYSWRLLFSALVPIGILDLFLAVIWMKDVLTLSFPKFDLWGAVFSTIGLGSLLYGVSEAGNKGWSNAEVDIFLAVGIFAIVLFIRRELTVDKPMLELRVYKYRIFSLTIIINAVVTTVMYAAMMLLPIYLQNIRGFTPLQSGFLLLPGALLMGVMGPIAGAVFDRIGLRVLAVVGLMITALATWEFTKLTSETMYDNILLLYTVRSLGVSLIMMPLMTAGLNQLPRRLNSHGTAMFNTMRQVSGSLGTAILVTIMTTRSTIHLATYASTVTSTNPSILSQLSNLASHLSLSPQTGRALALQEIYALVSQQATIQGINDSFIVATVLAFVGLIPALFIKKVIASKTDPA